MTSQRTPCLSRRSVLRLGAAAALAAPLRGMAAPGETGVTLRAGPGRAPLVGPPHPETATWCYNGTVPGPEIRVRQGERARVRVENALPGETTVHWHGIRLPNAMDGVPHLTQAPIAPGTGFDYAFDVPDAGTFWYHPHQRSHEQVGRGLYGALIVEETEPIRVDREMVWMLDDWRLTREAAISEDFGNGHDLSHQGRIGNTVTINGQVPDSFAVRAGERIRLRLINAANARIFGLDFEGLEPVIVALDGQPVSPHTPDEGLVVLGPAMRADVVLDMAGQPGSRISVVDRFYEGRAYRLVDLAYAGEPLRARIPDWPLELPPNPLPEPDLDSALRHEIVFNGGMMGQGMMGANMDTMMRQMREGRFWFLNGEAAMGHVMEPLLTLAKGQSCVLALANDTAWHHPMHLHGHAFLVISRDGAPTRHREWLDTVLMAPRERVEIAFAADNPGDWMFHCHILEHQEAGMMGVIRVTEQETKT